MSDYDPVEVTPLHADEVARMEADALAAIAAADDLDALKQARLAHAGDRSPIALANREIGALPPPARAEAGKRVGGARKAIDEALAARQAELEAERDERVLVEEAVDVTLPWDRRPARRPPPADHAAGAHRRRLRRDGLRGRRGPRGRRRVVQLRRAQHRPGPPGPLRAGHLLRRAPRDSGMVLRTQTSPVQIRALLSRELPRATSSRRARSSAPTSSTPRTPRSSTRSRGWPSTRA